MSLSHMRCAAAGSCRELQEAAKAAEGAGERVTKAERVTMAKRKANERVLKAPN